MDTARIWYIEKFRWRLGLVTNALQLLPLCQDQPAGRQSRCCNQLRWPYSTFWSGFHKRPKASGSCAKWGTERPGPYASVQSRLDRSNVTCVWPTTEVQHVHGATSPRPLWLLLWPRPCLARSQRANVWQIFETRRTDTNSTRIQDPPKNGHTAALSKKCSLKGCRRRRHPASVSEEVSPAVHPEWKIVVTSTFDTNHSGAFLRFLPAAASQYVRIWRPKTERIMPACGSSML